MTKRIPAAVKAHAPVHESRRSLPATVVTLLVVFAPALLAVPRAAAVLFDRSLIDANGPSRIYGKTVGDLNQDGRPDLVAGGNGSAGLVWYENPTWQKREIAPGGGFLTDHEVCDVDGDGLNDVVALRTAGIVWYASPGWVPSFIAADTLHDVEVADFDDDGDLDIIGRNQSAFGGNGNILYHYEQVSPDSWLRSTRQIPHGEGLKQADVDGDGLPDIIVNEVWLRNSGADFLSWQEYSYAASWTHENAYIDVGDFNVDGRTDIVPAPSEREGQTYHLSWFEGPEDPLADPWQEHVVQSGVETVLHFAGVGDFDRDGFSDIAVAEMQQGQDPDGIDIYINADGQGLSWSKEVVDTIGSHSMRVFDVDGDGDLDLYGANWEGDDVCLWVNQPALAPCVLTLQPSYADGTLTLEVALGTPEPATWNVFLFSPAFEAR